MKKLIDHFKLWNKWRKGSLNSKAHKFKVLLKIDESPTMEVMKILESGNAIVKGFEDGPKMTNHNIKEGIKIWCKLPKH